MENSGLPFKVTPQFILDLVLRRRWFILAPVCLALIYGIYLAIVLPKIYEARTLILIEGQSVPQNYVRSIITEDTAQRINTISQQILSTSNLERIIKDFRLFEGPEYRNMYLEDKVANLRRRISVDVIGNRRETEAFTITFKGKEPRTIMNVANALASNFIDENLKVRETQALGTSQFLDSELDAMRGRLEETEEAIKNYRKNNMGELPEQLETNLRILDRLQESLTDQQQQLREARVRLADLQTQSTTSSAPVVIIEGAGRNAQTTGGSLEELRAELQSLESRYTQKHPDIVRLKARIAEMEAEAEAAVANEGDPAPPPARMPPQLRAQILDTQREIQLAEAEIENLKSQINDYQHRIENTPKREQELLGLRRDYQNIQASYDSLLNRKLEADIAVNMERKQKGEQFRVVDPARLPQRPVEPDMRKIFLMIVAAGFGVGGGIAFLLEYLKAPFRDPEAIEEAYEIPVLTSVPFIMKKKDILLKRLNVAGSLVFTGIVGCLLAVFTLMTLKGPERILNLLQRVLDKL